MDVLFITSVAVVTADPPRSRSLFIDALGLPLEGEGDGYYSSGDVAGSKHFGVWPLSQAAEACFGTPSWPPDRVVPQASIEFEVADADAVAAAGEELQSAGFELLHPALDDVEREAVVVAAEKHPAALAIEAGIGLVDPRRIRQSAEPA